MYEESCEKFLYIPLVYFKAAKKVLTLRNTQNLCVVVSGNQINVRLNK